LNVTDSQVDNIAITTEYQDPGVVGNVESEPNAQPHIEIPQYRSGQVYILNDTGIFNLLNTRIGETYKVIKD
jgi:hypothetical protein